MINSSFTQYKEALECLDFDIYYNYSPSVFPLMSYIIICRGIIEQPEAFVRHANIYELTVRQISNNGNFLEAQLLHLALFISYFSDANEERMTFHLKSALDIAHKYNFIYFVADAYPYYTSVFNSILDDYPQEFADKIRLYGIQIDKSFSVFTKSNNSSKIYYLLSNSDIKFVLYAAQRYTNKQVAEILHVSERTVANRYALICEKLGIGSKNELLEMIKKEI